VPEWIKFPVVLLIVTLISAVSLASLEKVTKPVKERIEAKGKKAALSVVLPKATDFKSLTATVEGKPFDYMEGLSGGEIVGYVAEAGAAGYSSIIKVMVGLDKEFKIVAIKVLSQKETPGLGDKVNEVLSKKTIVGLIQGKKYDEKGLRPWFQIQFDGKQTPVMVNKDGGKIEAITGATISSRAVCRAVNEATSKIKTALSEGKK